MADHSLHDGERYTLVSTRLGKLRGLESQILGQRVQSFLGIPFAEPPIGDNRFKPPIVKKPWNDVLDAVHLSPACYQVLIYLLISRDKTEWVPLRHIADLNLPLGTLCL